MRALRAAIWVAAAALCTAMFDRARDSYLLDDRKWAAHFAVMLVAVTVGLVLWDRRPQSRIGILMTAAPLAAMLSDLRLTHRGSPLAVTIGFATVDLVAPIFAQMVLSYPSGRLTSRLDRAFVVVAYLFVFAQALPYLLFYSPLAPRDEEVWECATCALPLTHVSWYDVAGIERVFETTFGVLVVMFLALLTRKLVRVIPGARRMILPLAGVMFFLGIRATVQLGLSLAGSSTNYWTSPTLFWTETIGILAVPLVLAAGLLSARRGRAAAADLLVQLEHTPPGAVRDALARTLRDPSLALALWLPDRGAYVDAAGLPFKLPSDDPGRAVTVLGDPEAPVAAVVHDPVLLERPGLLEAAGAAVRLALENERLQAELRLQLDELRASRARIVQAGDDARRRLERNLHDGAQQRLLGLGLALGLARAHLGTEANGAADLLAEADEELRAALDELRELARGIHPAVLTEQGLRPALKTLADRSPVPVTIVAVPEERLPPAVEAAAYFLVSEALANVAKYARASRVRVTIAGEGGRVTVDVDDDGVGGADPSRGSGLRGLADRVHALDGDLTIESQPGGGTHVHADLACA